MHLLRNILDSLTQMPVAIFFIEKYCVPLGILDLITLFAL